jgi:hypothetical protein
LSLARLGRCSCSNLLVFVPFALFHFVFGWRVSRGYDGPKEDIPLMAISEWAWIGWCVSFLRSFAFDGLNLDMS